MMQEPQASLKLLHIAALVLLLLAFSVSVDGTPSINLPINAQVPPVARPNEAYNFVFSDSTFSWAGNSIEYSLTNYSGWLQLDSSGRVFSGTPGSSDTGSIVVSLVATDDTGSNSMSVTFVVSADPGPGLGTPVAEQLPAFGPVPSPVSLSLAPSSALSLSFSPATFTNTNANTVYYAICANNTPLPSWVNFHPSSLGFSGTTPSSTSPSELPQTFGIHLIASNVLGFAEAIASFQLVITNHLLTFGNSLHVINVTNGALVNYPGLQRDLTLDGQPANSADIRQVAASTPPWMSFNSSTLALSGTPPANSSSQNITVTASDIYGDTASTVVLIQAVENLASFFTGPFATVNATQGANFTYDLSTELATNTTADVAVKLGAASVWLKFNSSSLELQGHIPADLKPQSVQVIVTTTQGSQSQSQNLTINIQDGSAPSAPTTDTHTVSPKATSGSTAGGNRDPDAASSASRPRRRWIAAAVLLPVSVALGCLLLLCFFLKRRRRKADKDSSPSPRWRISHPVPVKNIANVEVREETPKILAIHEKRASSRASKPPWLDFLGFQIPGHSKRGSKSRASNGTIFSAEQSAAPDSVEFSLPGRVRGKSVLDVSRTSEKHAPRRADNTSCGLKAPPLAVQRLSAIMDNSPTKRNSRQRERRSTLSYDSASVFSNYCLNGVGHGRHTRSRSSGNFRFNSKGVGHGNGLAGGPPGFGIVRNSWRNLSRSTWASTDGSSDLGMEREATLGRFQSTTRPPTSNTFGKGSVIHEVSDDEGPRRPTLRPVTSPAQSRIKRKSGSPSRSKTTILKADPLQSFHKRRLQQRSSSNPLFSAGPSSSRLSSLRRSKAAPSETTASPPRRTRNNPASDPPVTPQRGGGLQCSYSDSSSLDPPPARRPSPSRSSGSTTPSSPRGPKSGHVKHNPTPRALLTPPKLGAPWRPNNGGGSRGGSGSWVSTTTTTTTTSSSDSKAPPPPSSFNNAFFGGGGDDDLREETDEHGHKRWLRVHPNPLGTHRLDMTDRELIDSLSSVSVSDRASAARRLSREERQAEAGATADDGGDDEDGRFTIGETRERRLGRGAGLRQGDPGNLSMRGDIGDTAAGSAFI